MLAAELSLALQLSVLNSVLPEKFFFPERLLMLQVFKMYFTGCLGSLSGGEKTGNWFLYHQSVRILLLPNTESVYYNMVNRCAVFLSSLLGLELLKDKFFSCQCFTHNRNHMCMCVFVSMCIWTMNNSRFYNNHILVFFTNYLWNTFLDFN